MQPTNTSGRLRWIAFWVGIVVIAAATQTQRVAAHPLIALRGTYETDAAAITIRVPSDRHTLGHLGLPADADGLDRFAYWLQAGIVILDRSGDSLAGSLRVDQEAGVVVLSFQDARISWPVSLQLRPPVGGLPVRGQLVLEPGRRDGPSRPTALILTTAGNPVRLDAGPDGAIGQPGASPVVSRLPDLLWPELDVGLSAGGVEMDLRAPIATLGPSACAGRGDPDRLPADERRALEGALVEWCRVQLAVTTNGRPVSTVKWRARIDVDDAAMHTAPRENDATLNRWLAVAHLNGRLTVPDLKQVEIRLLPGIGSGSIKAAVCLSGQRREGVLTEQDPTVRVALDGASVRLSIGRVAWLRSVRRQSWSQRVSD